jgi:polyhydroxybutyrate depolymerase
MTGFGFLMDEEEEEKEKPVKEEPVKSLEQIQKEYRKLRLKFADKEHDTIEGKNYKKKIKWDDITRTYYVHTPPDYNSDRPYPLVINFHAEGSFAKEAEWKSEMLYVANEEGFIALHPEASGDQYKQWNGGDHSGGMDIDDVGFVAEMLDEIIEDFSIDADRIYATGLSSGGFMAYRLACEMSDRIAAVAPVAAVLDCECEPQRPIPIMHFHGTEDGYVPYKGGVGALGGYAFPSVGDTMNFWLTFNECSTEPEITYSVDDTTCYEYESEVGADVVLCIIEGGGHVWPGGGWNAGETTFYGWNTDAINATDAMWEFFENYALGRRN